MQKLVFMPAAIRFSDWLDDLVSQLQKVWWWCLFFSRNTSSSIEVKKEQRRGDSEPKPTKRLQFDWRPERDLGNSVAERWKDKRLLVHQHDDCRNTKQRGYYQKLPGIVPLREVALNHLTRKS
jgi:hypothetical protein